MPVSHALCVQMVSQKGLLPGQNMVSYCMQVRALSVTNCVDIIPTHFERLNVKGLPDITNELRFGTSVRVESTLVGEFTWVTNFSASCLCVADNVVSETRLV